MSKCRDYTGKVKAIEGDVGYAIVDKNGLLVTSTSLTIKEAISKAARGSWEAYRDQGYRVAEITPSILEDDAEDTGSTLYAIVNKEGLLVTIAYPTLEEAKSAATEGFASSWETIRNYGYRAAEVKIKILEDSVSGTPQDQSCGKTTGKPRAPRSSGPRLRGGNSVVTGFSQKGIGKRR